MTVENIYDQSPPKTVAGHGSNPQPPDHHYDEHPTEPPRPAVLNKVSQFTFLTNFVLFVCLFVLFGLYVAFNDLSVISRQYLVVAGS